LFAFLISCENPLIEEVWGLKTVTFDTNGGGYIPQQKLLRGERILKPADPAKNGYDFCGWFEDNGSFHNKWDFNTAPDRTLTLYAKWEAEPDSTILYTLILDASGLTNDMDTASFSESGVVLETAAFNGDVVTVCYTLADTHNNNWFSLSINGDRVFETETPEAGTYSYTVNHSDADNGVITIHASSIHSNLNLLYPPNHVHFNETGVITFTEDDKNPSGTTYWYTLFRDELEVDGFTNIQITSGTIPAGIVNEMLENPGKYHVEAWAQTSDEGYQSQSGSIESDPVHVYQVNLIISGITDGESITYGTTSYSSNETFAFCVFNGDTIMLTANFGNFRKVTWSGAGVGTDNTYTVIVTETTIITAEFAEKLIVTVSANGGAAENYASLDAVFDAIGTQAGNFTVTLYEDQVRTVTRVMTYTNMHTTIVGEGSMRTINCNNIGTDSAFLVLIGYNSSFTLGDNVTIKGRTAAGAGAVMNIQGGTFTMQGNSRIQGHNVNGTYGAVNMTGGTFNMKDNSVITGVTASTETSAAVYLNNANATFNMEGGQITANNNTIEITNTGVSGGVIIANGTFNMTGGSITGNTHLGEASDVYISVMNSDRLTISGNAQIGVLKLNAGATAGASVTIESAGWNGSIGKLNLRGNDNDIATVAGYWNNRQIFNNITASQIAQIIALGEFINSNNARQAISPAYIIGKEGTDLGKLVLNPATAPVAVNDGTADRGYSDLNAAFAAIGATPGNYTVTLRANQTLGAQSLSANQRITFVSSDSNAAGERTIQYSGANNSQMFSINNMGASLTLGNNITIMGIDGSTTDLLSVKNGTLTMLNGSKITGHKNTSTDLISVNGENASFNMSGGSITGNTSIQNVGSFYSGGIYLSSGTVEITGGSIKGNMPADIAFAPNAAATFKLSGSAEIGVIMLDNSNSNPVISLPSTFTGNVAALHMRSIGTDTVNAVINLWNNKQIIQAASGYALTPADIAKFTLGNFYRSYEPITSQAIDFSNYINESGVLVERLVYNIGDTGPAGGRIIYVNPNGFTVQGYGSPGDTGYFAEYTAYYLEAATANETASEWGAYGTTIDGITTWANATAKDAGLAASIGVGRKDTQTIVNSTAFASLTDTAAQRCADKTLNGFTDWFLPSLGELIEMYKARTYLSITSGIFWSSSQSSNSNAWGRGFGDGYQDSSYSKDRSNVVRAVRVF